nr:MAG TPA: hypothetical protein [Bacteriophage sp.]
MARRCKRKFTIPIQLAISRTVNRIANKSLTYENRL